MVRTKRIYEPAEATDGYRVLVDRIWPRGVSKDAARLDLWLKEVAPTAALRKWFGHEPERFTEFKRRYRDELAENPAVEELLSVMAEHERVTLLYGARDKEHNQAAVLAAVLEERV